MRSGRGSISIRGERRRIGPLLRFGEGVFRHMLGHGRRYDVVHSASFPFFSVLALALVRPFCCFDVVCDWHEVWSRGNWNSYLGPIIVDLGSLDERQIVQLCRRAEIGLFDDRRGRAVGISPGLPEIPQRRILARLRCGSPLALS